jgi:hypothetical protein
MENKTLYSMLALAGVLPFLACASLPIAGVAALPPFGALDELAASYGLAIIAFLTGIHWATYLYRQGKVPFNLMITSNVVFLAVWFAYVLGSVSVALIVQIVAFMVILIIDGRLSANALLTRHYLGIRSIATALAIASLAIIILS